MKARIGITAPLQLTTRAAGTLVLPYFAQRNFSVPASVKHSIIIDSKDRFLTQAAPMVAEPPSPAPFAHVTVERPAGTAGRRVGAGSDARSSRVASGDRAPDVARATDPRPVAAGHRRRRLGRDEGRRRARGGGARRASPRACRSRSRSPVTTSSRTPAQAAALAGEDFAGGTDSLPALVAAWDLAAAEPGSVVLWIHGPQPVVLASPEPLRQRIERRTRRPAHLHVRGRRRREPAARRAGRRRRRAHRAAAAGRAATTWSSSCARSTAAASASSPSARARPATSAGAACRRHQTSDHLARLWARERIAGPARRPASRRRPRKQALALASRYHLVTPVSGAVVLESKAQYDEAGADARRRKPGPDRARAGHLGADLVAARWRCWSRASRMLGARRAI